MAAGVKLPHIVSDNNLIKVVHRFVLSPFQTLRRRKCTGFSKFFSYLENGSSADPSCLNSICFSKYVETLAMRNLSFDFKCFKDFSVDIIVPN